MEPSNPLRDPMRPNVSAPLPVLLDPRPPALAANSPLAGAVNIPASELAERMHELPPRHELIQIADLPGAAAALEFLLMRQRRAVIRTEISVTNTPVVEEAVTAQALPKHGAMANRLWRPSPWVERIVADLQPGRALDVACGTGRDAVYLATCGWQVWGNDILPDALVRATDLAGRYAATAATIHWSAHPAATLPARDMPLFDLAIFVRFLDRALIRRAREWLAPGGVLAIETFTTLHRERHGRPSSPDLCVVPGELPRLLSGWEIITAEAGWGEDGAHTARIAARRP